MSTDDPRPLIVVGVDGSSSGQAALNWAYTYASTIGADVELITAWQWPYMYAGFGVISFGAEFVPETSAQEMLDKIAADSPLPEDRMQRHCVSGSAGAVLLEASKHASLLVVGARGHGPIGRMMLGSTSTECVHNAHCPVVVVPAPNATD